MSTPHEPSNGILRPGETIGFIGGGNMSKSIAIPLFQKGLLLPENVIVSTSSESSLVPWKNLGCRTTLDNLKLLQESNVVIWAIKPQMFPGVLSKIYNDKIQNMVIIEQSALYVSIMAGIPLDLFSDQIMKSLCGIDNYFKFIRVMPNIGVKVACGVSVYAGGSGVLQNQKNIIESIFKPLGLCYEVEEAKINAYNGLFGSGIGFMFPIIEALSDGAVKMGIPRAISLEIAAQVMKGAGELVLLEKSHPGTLKDMVCSPGGTTIAGITELERGGIRATIINAVEAATNRGTELGAIAKQSSTDK